MLGGLMSLPSLKVIHEKITDVRPQTGLDRLATRPPTRPGDDYTPEPLMAEG